MKIVTVKCESCGASIKIDDESSIFTCEYCKTTLKLMRTETPRAAQPPPSKDADPFGFQMPSFFTKIFNSSETIVHHINRFLKPAWIAAYIVAFVIIISVSIIVPLTAASWFGGNSSGANSQLPTNPMTPLEYSGTGDKVVSGINLQKGNYYAKLTNSGSSNFIVKFYYGGKSSYMLLANKIGTYSGYSLLDDALGEAVSDGSLEVTSKGDWTVIIYEISETSGSSVSGTGDYVTGVISGLSGRKAVTMSNSGSSNFIVRLYTYNSGKSGYTLAANVIGDYSGQTSASFSSNSKYYFSIQSSGSWMVSIG